MATEHDIFIAPDGTVTFIYDDDLAGLFPGAASTVTRASHVEPHPTQAGWIADMRPSDGPIIGDGGEYVPQSVLAMEHFSAVETHLMGVSLKPFATRQAALDAERAWLLLKMEGR